MEEMNEFVNPNGFDAVTYVDPNWQINFDHTVSVDGREHEKQVDLSDLCIAVDLEVEITDRAQTSLESQVIRMEYTTGKGENKISFFEGTKMRNVDSGMMNGDSFNVLTSNNADAYYYDEKEYGVNELLGIKSINVSYNNMMAPVIDIDFTDVRGLALFSREESKSDEANSDGALHTVKSFFHSFFTFPYPKYTIILKGFYGQSVKYEMTCADFKAGFKSDSGDFEAHAKFVGYAFSFLTDLSVLSLMAAPYSDGIGKEYWNRNVQSRFTIEDKDGKKLPMKTLGELMLYTQYVENEIKNDLKDDPRFAALLNPENVGSSIDDVRESVKIFYDTLEERVNPKQIEQVRYNDSEDGVDIPIPTLLIDRSEDLEFPIACMICDERVDFDSDNISSNGSQIANTIGLAKNISKIQETIKNFNEVNGKELKVPFSKCEYGYWRKISHTRDKTKKTGLFSAIIKTKVSDDELKKFKEKYNLNDLNNIPIKYIKEYWLKHPDVISSIKFEIAKGHTFSTSFDTYSIAYDFTWEEIEKKEGGLELIVNKGYVDNQDLFISLNVVRTTKETEENINSSTIRNIFLDKDNKPKEVPGIYGDVKNHFIKLLINNNLFWQKDLKIKKDFYICFFTIGYDFNLNNLEEEINNIEAQEEELEKEVDLRLKEEMGPYLTIRNLTKIYMAHFETLMYMLYSTIDAIKSNPKERSIENLGVGYDNLLDTPSKKYKQIPPFPSLSKVVKEDDGERDIIESTWTGDNTITNGRWRETDLVLSLLNGGDMFSDLAFNMVADSSGSYLRTNVMSNPITIGDLLLQENPFTRDVSSASNIDIFIRELVTRAMNIGWAQGLSLEDDIDYKHIGELDAKNIYDVYGSIFGGKLKQVLEGDVSQTLTPSIILEIAEGGNLSKDYNAQAWGQTTKPIIRKGSVNDTAVYFYNFPSKDEKTQVGSSTKYVLPYHYYETDANKINGDISVIGGYDDNTSYVILKDYNTLYSKISELNGTESYENLISITFDNESVYEAYINDIKPTNERFANIARYPKTDEDGNIIEDSTPFEYTELVDTEGIIQSNEFMITNVFGFDSNGEKTDKYSLFTQPKFYNTKEMEKSGRASEKLTQMAIFLLSFDIGTIKRFVNTVETTGLVPYIRVLQLAAFDYLNEDMIAGSWPQKIARKWSNAVESHLDLYKTHDATISRSVHRKELEDFTRKYYVQVMSTFGFDKFNLTLFYRDLPTSLKSADSVEKLSVISEDILNKYRSIGDEVDQNGFKAICKESGNNSEILNVLLTPAWMLTITKYALNGYSETQAFMEREHLRAYLEGAITKLSEKVKLNATGNIEQSNVRPGMVSNSTEDSKIALYNYLKLLYDKWIPTNSFNDWKFETFFEETSNKNGHSFYFVDSFYNDVGDKIYYNWRKLAENLMALCDNNNYTMNALVFMSQVYSENKMQFCLVQNFMDISKPENMAQMFQPVPYVKMNKNHNKHPDFVVIYPYEASKSLDIEGDYNDDSFMLDDYTKMPVAVQKKVTSRPKDTKDKALLKAYNNSHYKIPAFGVAYGKQYQHYFESIDVNMDKPATNEVALKAKFNIANSATGSAENGKVVVTSGQDLYSVYSNNAYTCKVTMMGCAWVQPLMYFTLLNVPIFRGSYLISNVQHSITPGDMKTTFTGTRMSNIASRINRNPISMQSSGGNGEEYQEDEKFANVDNDCPYKIFPLFNEGGGENLSGRIANKEILEWVGITVATEEGTLDNGRDLSLTQYLQIAAIYNMFAIGKSLTEMKQMYDKCEGPPENRKSGEEKYRAKYKEYNEAIKNIFTYSPSWILTKETKTTVKTPVKVVTGGSNYKTGELTKSIPLKIEDLQKLYHKCEADKYQKQDHRNWTMILHHRGSVYTADGQNENKCWESKNEASNNPGGSRSYEEIRDALRKALQQTLDYNGTTSCEINLTQLSDKTIVINQKDTQTNHLHQVYDILLNGYSNYLTELDWCASDASDETPSTIRVKVCESSPGCACSVCEVNGKLMKSADGKGFSKNLYMSCIKKYGADFTSSKQFKSDWKKSGSLINLTKENLDKIKEEKSIFIKDCNSVKMGNNVTLYNPNATIGNWRVGDAVNYLRVNGRSKSESRCAAAVKTAISQGGVAYVNEESGWKVKNGLEKLGWNLIKEGNNSEITSKRYIGNVGDVVCEKYADLEEVGHICMYCGEDAGWISDFKQPQCAAHSSHSGGHFWHYRYSGSGMQNVDNPPINWPKDS